MTIHSRRVNAVMKRPTRPQMLQTIPRKRPPHADFHGYRGFVSAIGGIFPVSANGPAMLPQAATFVEL
jgi:hypothetical protein